MSNFKGSTEVFRVEVENHGIFIMSGNYCVARCGDTMNTKTEANTKLFADAGNVRQQIDVDLPELLKQRNELLSKLKEFCDDADGYDLDILVSEAQELINKCTGV